MLYITNLMTQPGETDGFDHHDHVRALIGFGPGLRIDRILGHSEPITSEQVERYAETGSTPIVLKDTDEFIGGVEVYRADLVDPGHHVRHCPERLASAVFDCLHELAGTDREMTG